MPENPSRPAGKIKVLIAGHLPPPMGGIGAYCEQLIHSSLSERVELRFVQTSSQTRDFATSGTASAFNILSALTDIARFGKAVFSFRPQVSHISTAFGLSFLKNSLSVFLARLSGSRVLLHPHCSFATLYLERPAWWKGFFRTILRLTDGLIVLSKEWEAVRAVVPKCPVHILPNAVDIAHYRPIAKSRLHDGSQMDPLHILYLGYLGQAKGSYELIEAAQKILEKRQDILFDLVGNELTPGEWDRLSASVNGLHLQDRIHLHPAVYGEEKLAFLRSANIFVYPSYHEGMPMAVLEAMACGLPVITSRVGGLPDLVGEGQNGFTVEPANSSQLATALEKLIADPGLRSSMGQCSVQVVTERFDLEKHIQQLENIYYLAVSRKQ